MENQEKSHKLSNTSFLLGIAGVGLSAIPIVAGNPIEAFISASIGFKLIGISISDNISLKNNFNKILHPATIERSDVGSFITNADNYIAMVLGCTMAVFASAINYSDSQSQEEIKRELISANTGQQIVYNQDCTKYALKL